MSVALISKTPKVSIRGMLFLIIIFDNKETFYVILEHDYTWPFPTDIDRKTSLVIFFLNVSYLLQLNYFHRFRLSRKSKGTLETLRNKLKHFCGKT